MDLGDIISSTLAGLSLIVAGLFAWRQTGLQARVTGIEQSRRDEEVEARRHALVRAKFELMENGTAGVIRTHGHEPVVIRSGMLILSNHGPAVARSVGFKLSAETEGSVPTVIGTEILPLAELHPGVPMSFPLLGAMGDCTIMLAMVTWTDDAGPHKKPYKLPMY